MKYEINNLKGIENIECFLFDMDGTLYEGYDPIPGAFDLIETLKSQGKRVMYISNNSSKVASDYIIKLKQVLNVDSVIDDFFTSADAIVYMMNKVKPGAKIYVVGTATFENFMEKNGFELVREYTQDPEKMPEFVVLGFDTTLTYDKLRVMCDYLVDGVRFMATHPDMVCPAEHHRSIPDVGSFLLLIEGATGRKPELIAGKPNPTMINIIAEKFGYDKEKICVVGDRMNTDIMSGKNAGVKTCVVLTGETDTKLLDNSTFLPDYIVDSVKDIYVKVKGKR